MTSPLFTSVDIYPVTGREMFLPRCTDEEMLEQLAQGGAKIVQLRDKTITRNELYRLALKYREVTARLGMLFIVNDHLDIAMMTGADGVHLGQSDLPIQAARKHAGPDFIIGASAHNVTEAVSAESAGATYCNIGPIFATGTKPGMLPVGLETFRSARAAINVPISVMGGIDESNIADVAKYGPEKIGVVTAIFAKADITGAVRHLRELIASGRSTRG